MKTLWTPSVIGTASALAFGLALITPSFAQQSADPKIDPAASQDQAAAKSAATATTSSDNRVSAATPPVNFQVASDDAKDRTDAKLIGREVKGSDGKGLGDIKDFLINPTTGHVEFAVVSSGGVAGLGDKLRLVPMSTLRATGNKGFSVAIDKASWDRIAPFAADAYKAKSITMTEAEHRQIAAHFKTAKSGTDTVATVASASLVKASDLHGKDVRSAGQNVGKIDGLVMDPAHATAQALFDPKRDFAGTTQKFIVPLNQFVLAGGHEPASALFTQEAFAQATTHQISSSSSGTLPVASNATTETAETRASSASTKTDRDAQLAATSTDRNDKHQDTSVTAGKTSSSQSTAASVQNNVASNSESSRQKDSTAPSAGGTTTSDNSLSHTDRADTNGVNPAAVASNTPASSAVINPETAAQADAKSPTSSPPNRSEQGQDIASTVPASPSSKAMNTDQATNNSAISSSTAQTSTGLAANSTPARASTTESTAPGTSPTTSDQNLTPTGRTSADQLPSNNPALTSAALAVRKALDDSPSLARLNVAVTPEGSKLVLRGSVASSQLKTAVEDTARRAAKDNMIDSQVTIEGQ